MFTLHRQYKEKYTIGKLMFPDNETYVLVLERPWLNNLPNISCIPEGEYVVDRDHHGRFQWWSVRDVPNRSAIEFHGGSKVSHSEGCLLLGTSFRNNILAGSSEALNKLLDFHGEDSFILKIVEDKLGEYTPIM